MSPAESADVEARIVSLVDRLLGLVDQYEAAVRTLGESIPTRPT